MSSRSVQSIRQYLDRYGDLFSNRKRAVSVGMVDANSLQLNELNTRLAQKLYDLGWCVNTSGKLLEENKCSLVPPQKAIRPVSAGRSSSPVIGQQRGRANTTDGYQPDYTRISLNKMPVLEKQNVDQEIAAIEDYLTKHGTRDRNQKWATLMGLNGTNDLNMFDLNRRLAYLLHQKGYYLKDGIITQKDKNHHPMIGTQRYQSPSLGRQRTASSYRRQADGYTLTGAYEQYGQAGGYSKRDLFGGKGGQGCGCDGAKQPSEYQPQSQHRYSRPITPVRFRPSAQPVQQVQPVQQRQSRQPLKLVSKMDGYAGTQIPGGPGLNTGDVTSVILDPETERPISRAGPEEPDIQKPEYQSPVPFFVTGYQSDGYVGYGSGEIIGGSGSFSGESDGRRRSSDGYGSSMGGTYGGSGGSSSPTSGSSGGYDRLGQYRGSLSNVGSLAGTGDGYRSRDVSSRDVNDVTIPDPDTEPFIPDDTNPITDPSIYQDGSFGGLGSYGWGRSGNGGIGTAGRRGYGSISAVGTSGGAGGIQNRPTGDGYRVKTADAIKNLPKIPGGGYCPRK